MLIADFVLLRSAHASGRERGLIIVIFALAPVVMIGIVGLVIDSSGPSAHWRSEQSVADVAPWPGMRTWTRLGSGRDRCGHRCGASFGNSQRHTHGVKSATIWVTVALNSSGAVVRVAITAPHSNALARVMGMDTWDVSVTAGSEAAVVDTGVGAVGVNCGPAGGPDVRGHRRQQPVRQLLRAGQEEPAPSRVPALPCVESLAPSLRTVRRGSGLGRRRVTASGSMGGSR